MTEQIYVALLDEGTSVWRPVSAQKLSDGTYRIEANLNPDDLGERWEFPPLSIVVCTPRRFADGNSGLAAVRLARAAG